ncbi:PREDICTED: heterogeneous nuclear ribonucleoprotein D0 [Nicrophorus vespilloides]|uniref:Heterogeneous nuclear ribonucleoprotein D0 n=1 Tax=Nicrophorus vespilloides TaxID=110193 RepID=A0ABM1MJR3_NICVS|nr:PREDICTED: heterogeneous nuclear ribonucleoprotein D0 [Nicrophorus vespilloides]
MDDDDLTVWCGNLPCEIDEEILYELFLQVAPLKKVRIPMQNKTNRPANFGFVTFKHLESVQYAINLLHNTKLFNTHIVVRQRTKNAPAQNPYDGNSSYGGEFNHDNGAMMETQQKFYPSDWDDSHKNKRNNKYKRHNERRSWNDYHENEGQHHGRNTDSYKKHDNYRHKHRYSDQNSRKRHLY